MDIKKRLQMYSIMKEELEQLDERIKELQDKMTNIRSQSFDGVIANSGNSDKIGETIATISDLQTLYIRKSNELMRETLQIEKMISKLDVLERVIIRKKYLECKTWETVCVEMNYSYRGLQNIHSRIIQKLRNSA